MCIYVTLLKSMRIWHVAMDISARTDVEDSQSEPSEPLVNTPTKYNLISQNILISITGVIYMILLYTMLKKEPSSEKADGDYTKYHLYLQPY